jgi:GTP-binding protein HflX
MSEFNDKYAILVTIAENTSMLDECERSLAELERLLNTAGGECFAKIIQVKDKFDPRTCIGKGKVEEVAALCKSNDVSLVVFDFELTPAQIRNLENDIGDVTVIDRSMLILDIFALHAVSGEGKLQVELAQLKYSAPRLTGKGIELSRQGGGIGSRGPGESKLETDRRHLHEKIVSLEKKLAELEHNRAVMRAQRDRSGLTKVALVGYTNAGKSTLLNKMTGADVLAEDKLFATLDPTTRKMELETGESILLTDTVGFIRKLPHHLVKAFKSTLDEVVYADILLIVSDINDPEVNEHLEVTRSVIEELGASDKPIIYVYNKCDLSDGTSYAIASDNSVCLSAYRGDGIDMLLEMIIAEIRKGKRECLLSIPYSEQFALNQLYNLYNVVSVDYLDDGIAVKVVLDQKGRGQYAKYVLEG